jgi:hypothetical protein
MSLQNTISMGSKLSKRHKAKSEDSKGVDVEAALTIQMAIVDHMMASPSRYHIDGMLIEIVLLGHRRHIQTGRCTSFKCFINYETIMSACLWT